MTFLLMFVSLSSGQNGQPGHPASYFIPTMQAPHQIRPAQYYQMPGAGPQQQPRPRWPAQNQMPRIPGATGYGPGMRAPRGPANVANATRPGLGQQGSRPITGPQAAIPVNQRQAAGAARGGAPSQPASRGQANFPPKQSIRPNAGAPAAQAITVPGQPELTPSMLADAAPQDQKQMLGERLYPLIHSMHADDAGKITGMLLEIDNSELLHMLEHPESLKAKVDEAVAVLQAHQAKAAAVKKE